MLRLSSILVVFVVSALYSENTLAAKCWKSGTVKFGCHGVSSLSVLDEVSTSVRTIWFEKSQFTNIPGDVFYRFRNKLQSIDMHLSGIQTIDSRAFNGLTHLVNLTLWGNSLEAIWADWFANLTQLKILDVSFNRISYIEEQVFQRIPNLEKLYIDSNYLTALNWNVFTYLQNLKRVKLGKNPWDWRYRAQITMQLDNQHVDYTSEWDDYDWINHVVWDCVLKHQASYDDDTVLDCASSYLIEERSRIVTDNPQITDCGTESKALYDCFMRTDPLQNVTITPKIAVRKILQGFIGAYQSMRHPDVKLTELGPN